MDGNGQLRNDGVRTLGYAQERPDPLVSSAIQALRRQGVSFKELAPPQSTPDQWARALAQCLASGDCHGGVVFCQDPGLICCIANKVAGVRAVPVVTVPQAGRALAGLAANLVAVEMPGRTFFEVRQILRLVCTPNGGCPDGVACTLRELDGHAHR